MLISEVFWVKCRNEWEFHCNYDDTEREWDKEDTGFLVIATSERIEGYCIRGHEEEWKRRLLLESVEKYSKRIDDLIEKKSGFLNMLRAMDNES